MDTQALEKTNTTHERVTPAQRRSLVASTVGQVLEWYEWTAYAVFAPFIARVMFNPENPVSAILSTLAVFAVGFLMRPLGGLVMGIVADRKGRKFVLIVTMLSMALAATAIGVMPSYESIGIWASVGLLLTRMIQGFAHGGEAAAAFSYVGELAPKNKRGLWGSTNSVGIFGGGVVAYTLGGVLTGTLPEAETAAWGWRIPFLLGAVFALIALWLRRTMIEPGTFKEKQPQPVAAERGSAPKMSTQKERGARPGRAPSQLKTALLLIATTSGLYAMGYTWISYVSTYAIVEQGMHPQSAYWAVVIAQAVTCASIPFWGMLSDRIGRKPMIYGAAALEAVLQFPLMGLISNQFWTLATASTIALLIIGGSGAHLAAYMSELFPSVTRTRNIGIVYGISVALFGGTAPYINQLFNSLDMGWMSSGWVVFLCLVTILGVLKLPETRGIELR